MASLQDRAAAMGRALLVAALCGLLALAIAAPMIEETLTSTGSGYRRLGYAVAAAVALIGLWPVSDWRRLLVLPWPLVVALAWCWLSMTWSAVPHEALVRLILTTLVVWVAFATIRHLGYSRALATIRIVLALSLLLNYVTLLLYPQWSIAHGRYQWSEYQWLGVMAHKNFAGALCAFTAIIFLFDVERRWRIPFLGVAVAAMVFVGFTASRTAMISGAAALLVGALVTALHRPIAASLLGGGARTWRAVGYALLALLVASLLFFTIRGDLLLGMMTESGLLSNRNVIWRQLVQAYIDQPWSGVGFGSYWTGAAAADLAAGRGAWLGLLDQGHNGLFDIAVQVGLPGLLLVLFAMLVWPVRMLARQIPYAPQASALLAGLLTLCLAANVTESGLLARDSLWSVLLVLTLALIAALGQHLALRQPMWATAETKPSPSSRSRQRRSSRAGSGERRRKRSSPESA